MQTSGEPVQAALPVVRFSVRVVAAPPPAGVNVTSTDLVEDEMYCARRAWEELVRLGITTRSVAVASFFFPGTLALGDIEPAGIDCPPLQPHIASSAITSA